MKLKISLLVLTAALVTFGLSGAAFAFHSGGVAACESCHTMHNSKNGTVMSRTSGTYITNNLQVGQAGAYLLQGTDQSSTCLNCHGVEETAPAKYHIMSLGQPIAVERTPGGDFAWLKKSSKKGHSIVAVDYGFGPDTTKAGGVAPGGTYPVASLHCSSCHDPHGRYRKLSTAPGTFAMTGEPIGGSGSYGADPTNGEAVGAYRLLGGKGYLPKSLGIDTLAFDEDPMNAAAPSTYNVSEATSEIVVNYGKGVGKWCQQCHPKMHMADAAINVHPNDQALGSTIMANYNNYVSSGNMVPNGGGYTSLIPVAYDSNITINSQLAGHFTTGALVASNDQVNCLSCHRAHASGFDSMLRFPIVEEMVVDSGTGPVYAATSGLTAAEVQAALYDRPATKWGAGQRTLCNKCHAKD